MHSLKQGFAEQFRVALKARFGRIPSAAFIARQVNLRFRGGQGISGETARRWLRGLAMPKYAHLGALAAWLDIDFRQVLKFSLPGDVSSPPPYREPASQPDGQARRSTSSSAISLMVSHAVKRMAAKLCRLMPKTSSIL